MKVGPMNSRHRRWLWLLPLILGVGAVVYVIRPIPGHVEVRVIQREDTSCTLLIHNGTRHRVYMSDFGLVWVGQPQFAGIMQEHSKPNAVEPNSEETWVVHVGRAPVPRAGVIFLPPWTDEEAERAKFRAQPWPKPIRDWLLRKYKPRDPRYLHSVQIPSDLKTNP
jgi:hypothetical protein